MPRRLLAQTLAGEDYATGAAYNISFEEEREPPDFTETYSPESSGTTHVYYCNWTERLQFIDAMLGFAKVNPSGKDSISGDSTGFNGKHIHRKLPIAYYRADDLANEWWVATRAVVTPDGLKHNIRNDEVTSSDLLWQNMADDGAAIIMPQSEYARIAVNFTAFDYDLSQDAEVFVSGVGGAVSSMYEYNRYTKIIQKPASIFFNVPVGVLKLVDWPDSSAPKEHKYPEPLHTLDNIADFWLYWYDIPYDPFAALLNCFGQLNKYPIFATDDFPTGQPAETLHFIAADIQILPKRMGRKYWNAQLGFRKVFNRDYGTGSGGGFNIRGHNYVRWIDNESATGNVALRFYRLSTDGTSDLSPGNPRIDVVDYGKLFWIP